MKKLFFILSIPCLNFAQEPINGLPVIIHNPIIIEIPQRPAAAPVQIKKTQLSPFSVNPPISIDSYDRKVLDDLNLIILGEPNVSEGAAYKISEDKSELTLSGKIISKNNSIVTLSGKLGTDGGAFIFDNEDGAKTGEISFGIFYSTKKSNASGYSYKPFESRRIALKIAEENTKWNNIEKIRDSIAYYEIIMYSAEIPFVSKVGGTTGPASLGNDALAYGTSKRLELSVLRLFLEKYLQKGHTMLTSPSVSFTVPGVVRNYYGPYTEVNIDVPDKKGKLISHSMNMGDDLNYKKLINDYEKAVKRLHECDENLEKGEISSAQDLWINRRIGYIGLIASYKRESFTSLVPNESFTSFEDMFRDIRGDLFEGTLSYNQLWQSKKAFFFGKGSISGGRQSNFSDFKKNMVEYNLPTGFTDAEGNSLYIHKSKTIYSIANNSEYQYAFGYSPGLEIYTGYNNFGLYSKIRYKEALKDKIILAKSLPFEAGTFVTVTSGKKDLVTILFFIARSDLQKHPENDMNVGIKVGLPFHFNKKL